MAVGKKLRFEVLKRDSFRCHYCGRAAPEVALHVDHIWPVSDGGKDVIGNLVTACQDCNAGKGPRPIKARSGRHQIVSNWWAEEICKLFPKPDATHWMIHDPDLITDLEYVTIEDLKWCMDATIRWVHQRGPWDISPAPALRYFMDRIDNNVMMSRGPF